MGLKKLVILCALLPLLGCAPSKENNAPARADSGPPSSKAYPEGTGFFKANSTEIPEVIRKTTDSVFTLVAPEGEILLAASLFKDPNLSVQQMIDTLKGKPETEDFSSTDQAVYIYQLKKCIEMKVEKECRIFEGVSYGTGFLTGDGSDLRTAAHVVEGLVRHALQHQPKSALPIWLVRNGQIVYSPEQLQAKFASLPEGIETILESSAFEASQYNGDQVLIRLHSPLAAGIPVAKKPLAAGEKAYLVGVPKKTSDRAIYNAPDSDGISVHITQGTVLSVKSLEERLNASRADMSETTFKKAKTIGSGVALTADGAPRFSGAVILNSQGEAVGVYNTGFPVSGAVYLQRVSYGSDSLL